LHRETHFAALQYWSDEQAAPQAPQLELSFCTSVHVAPNEPLHIERFEAQPHVPDMQCMPFVHARWQPPQFESSLWMDAHELLHTISSGPHIETHLPFEQSQPVSHDEPHAPQFAESPWRLTHEPPQFVEPCGQAHLPLTHVADWTQVELQAPQLLGSLWMSTHAPLQNVRLGDEHVSWHTPATQDAPAGHE
jgi:hypothetical protein